MARTTVLAVLAAGMLTAGAAILFPRIAMSQNPSVLPAAANPRVTVPATTYAPVGMSAPNGTSSQAWFLATDATSQYPVSCSIAYASEGPKLLCYRGTFPK